MSEVVVTFVEGSRVVDTGPEDILLDIKIPAVPRIGEMVRLQRRHADHTTDFRVQDVLHTPLNKGRVIVAVLE